MYLAGWSDEDESGFFLKLGPLERPLDTELFPELRRLTAAELPFKLFLFEGLVDKLRLLRNDDTLSKNVFYKEP